MRTGRTYRGVVFEGPCIEVTREVPQGGVDIIDTKVFWRLTSGSQRCMTPRELQQATPTELSEAESVEAYEAVAPALGYTHLGWCRAYAQVRAPLDSSHALEEQRWATLRWELPESTVSS